MTHYVELISLFLCAVFLTTKANYNPFMDNILFHINWPDKELVSEPPTGENTIVVTTAKNEKYSCVLPELSGANDGEDKKPYTGPNELQLLKLLFDQTSCSYKIESYWTYELCHGKHLRQYHEEKEPGKVTPKIQEYFLGKLTAKELEEVLSKATLHTETHEGDVSKEEARKKAPVKKVEGIEIPYYEVNLTGGTPCDLTGHPRRVGVHYVCHTEGRGEIYELKETSTCEYEVVVLTATLCSHPLYQQKKDAVNKIECQAMEGSPRRPKGLDDIEKEDTLGRYNRKEPWNEDIDEEDLEDEMEDAMDAPSPKLFPSIKEALFPKKKQTKTYYEKQKKEKAEEGQPPAGLGDNTDRQLLNDFLSGEHCIQGGTGWWKHEFCYGKRVTQFHEMKAAKSIVVLGSWDQRRHIDWLHANPHKRIKSTSDKPVKSVSHFYGEGDMCEPVGRYRMVEVKLKCKDDPEQPHAISIYLLEPKTCEYTLVVESPILCPLLENADENGLLSPLPQP